MYIYINNHSFINYIITNIYIYIKNPKSGKQRFYLFGCYDQKDR